VQRTGSAHVHEDRVGPHDVRRRHPHLQRLPQLPQELHDQRRRRQALQKEFLRPHVFGTTRGGALQEVETSRAGQQQVAPREAGTAGDVAPPEENLLQLEGLEGRD
jgi:hypothetical protein